MSLNLLSHAKSKFKSFLNLWTTPIIKDESKFLVAQRGPLREVDEEWSHYSIISTRDKFPKLENHLKYPIAKDDHYPSSICNGLLLLLLPGSRVFCTGKMTKPPGEALWNPTTGEFKILPLPPSNFDPRFVKMFYDYFGFGFDSASEDYKDTWSRAVEEMRRLEIWVWDGSWSLVSTLTVPLSVGGLYSLVGTDKLIFLDIKDKLMLFDCATRKLEKIRDLPTCTEADCMEAHVFPFVESYVSLDG
ncbi:F-box protein [Striga asiatica]|uniref:F-box protein n=1 Tax=Striga asiatica TaxID=4170 RepID=A0A5A7RI55_STRAF|nr:F-box protein [Striga asiatica]